MIPVSTDEGKWGIALNWIADYHAHPPFPDSCSTIAEMAASARLVTQ